jgi:hypothetical protein
MKRGFIFGLKIFAGVVAFGLALGFIVMSLWNWLVPDLFAGPVINFYQALGLLLLGKILFGGFKKWGCGNHCCGVGKGYMKHHWRKRLEEKMENMTPEEREKIKASYKKCCGFDYDESKQGES